MCPCGLFHGKQKSQDVSSAWSGFPSFSFTFPWRACVTQGLERKDLSLRLSEGLQSWKKYAASAETYPVKKKKGMESKRDFVDLKEWRALLQRFCQRLITVWCPPDYQLSVECLCGGPGGRGRGRPGCSLRSCIKRNWTSPTCLLLNGFISLFSLLTFWRMRNGLII